MTPMEAWSGEKPSVSHLRIFGCIGYAHIPAEKRTKLDDKSTKCIFTGYTLETKGYRLYNTTPYMAYRNPYRKNVTPICYISYTTYILR